MITMTSLVFSITMVVLTLAANQFGPRLIRNFMANLQTQIVLGTFVMTILYCLIVLSAVDYRESENELPFFIVIIAILLTGVSTALLVVFIHTLARSIVSAPHRSRLPTSLRLPIQQQPLRTSQTHIRRITTLAVMNLAA
jgi:uncharacterized membrane protein